MKDNVIVPDKFLKSTRDSGYKSTSSAIAELVDNSLDAGASVIRIFIYTSGGQFEIAVFDNGRGMNQEELAVALLFGGSNKYDSRASIGRYGFGLPNAGLSQAKGVIAITWKKEQPLIYAKLSLDKGVSEVKQLDIDKIPEKLSSFYNSNSAGTAIFLKNCDRLSFKRIKTIEQHLEFNLGSCFRKFLDSKLKLYINDKKILPNDPLFQQKGQNLRGAKSYSEPLVYKIRIPADPKKTTSVVVKFVELPINLWAELSNEQKRKHRITLNPGMSILRADREIDAGWFFMGSKTKQNYDSWWRAELSFQPCLDELFGVTHTKQQIKPSEFIKSIISKDIEGLARALYNRVIIAFKELNTEQIKIFSKKNVEQVDYKLEPPRSRTLKINKLIADRAFISKKVIEGITYTLKAKELDSRHFFSSEFNELELIITLNTRHRFYQKIYCAAKANHSKEYMKQIELLIFSAARSESLLKDQESFASIEEFKLNWGKILATFI